MTQGPVDADQVLLYARDLATLRGARRALRRRIESEATELIRRILVVEGDPLMRALIAATLSPETYEISEAGSIQEALDLLRGEPPAVVLLDPALPDGSGLSLCRQLKAEPTLSDISVVVLTEPTSSADWQAARRAGADRYLTRPFSPLKLLLTVEDLLC